MGYKGKWQLIFLFFFVLAACARGVYHQVKPVETPAPGIYHRVKSGETLSGIGRMYGASYQELARLNQIRNPDRIRVGQKILIPRPLRQAALRPPVPSQPLEPHLNGKAPFIWPLEGAVTSRFGPRNGSFHDGVDIGAPMGTPVRVAADGRVIYSDVLRGYGNVIIVRHGQGYVTVYAHNKVNHVKEGEEVRQGQRIAEVGTSGRTTGPSLHFEVRKDNLARDPLRYLPQDGRLVQRP